MLKGQKLTAEHKLLRVKTLATLKLNGGNLAKTSRDTKVPRSTIRKWRDANTAAALKVKARKADQKKEAVAAAEVKHEAVQETIAEDVETAVRLSADKMERVVADLVQSIHDDIKNPKLRFGLRDKALTAAILFDKAQLARGEPTNITKFASTLTEEERLARVKEIMATARQRRLNETGQEMGLLDGGKTEAKKQKAK